MMSCRLGKAVQNAGSLLGFGVRARKYCVHVPVRCARQLQSLHPCVPENAYHAGIWDGLFSTVDLVSLYWTFAARSLAVATPLQRLPSCG